MQEAQPVIVARPVRWRIVLTMTVLTAVGACIGVVIARLLYGAWDTDVAFTIACWLVAGLVVGLVHAWRQRRAILLSATELEVPAAWGGTRRLARDEVDPEASGRRSRLDVLLLRDVVRGRRGERLSLSRWSYAAQDLNRLKCALGIVTRGDGRGV